MPIKYDEVMQLKSVGYEFSYTDRETMLYALGVGFGRDPLNRDELKFVYENDLQTVPTMATVLAFEQSTLSRIDLNYIMVVHGEQRLTLHKPLPYAADVISDERVAGLIDKGAGKGALVLMEKIIREKQSGDKLCTMLSTVFARGDGGFGGPREGAPEPHPIPMRAPDLVQEYDTRPDQALLYALSGDRNPLHRDPQIAQMAGYPRPILQGLCTYGVACRAIVSSVCRYDAKKIVGFDVRFSAPVYPGETIMTDIWVDGPIVSFRSRVKERETVVLNNGKCTLAV